MQFAVVRLPEGRDRKRPQRARWRHARLDVRVIVCVPPVAGVSDAIMLLPESTKMYRPNSSMVCVPR